MRRAIGVAHVHKSRETKRQMTDLGAQITAERVAQIADQLESLEEQLRTLARKYKNEIATDPAVRARFKQISDSLGVDLISSKKNVFAELLGLGDFYYGLAGKVVEACMREQKFFGSYVPLSRIVSVVNRQYNACIDEGERCVISEGDIHMALSKLHVLGDGYDIVKLTDVNYIQTTPCGSCSADDVSLLEYVLSKQAKKILNYRAAQRGSQLQPQHVAHAGSASPTGGRLAGIHVARGDPRREAGVKADAVGNDSNVPFEVTCVSITQEEIVKCLAWHHHRFEKVIQRLVQCGSVWVEKVEGSDSSVSEDCRVVSKDNIDFQEDAIYWFVDLACSG
uniref:Uncharacterized protein n=1 Tax=Trypanosoma congolense (strain IL3000) TaxID=1068625 RepID=G0ULC8_TRYCI|nr:conserved hypothetical protein [Trypanosoma congolense IL3000]